MACWRAVLASVCGTAHLKTGTPCQDYGSFSILSGGILLGALSDGAGTATHAALGARLAAASALKQLREEIWPEDALAPEKAEELARRILAGALEELKAEAAAAQLPPAQLACTLIAFAATPRYLFTLQLGDGFFVAKLPGHFYTLTVEPLRGEYINETAFITQPDAARDLRVRVLAGTCEFLCAGTDGMEPVCLGRRNWTPHVPFFRNLEEQLRLAPDQADAQLALEQFLSSERLNARTDDDKTLLLGCLGSEGWA